MITINTDELQTYLALLQVKAEHLRGLLSLLICWTCLYSDVELLLQMFF